jgi:hypothetical protein
VPLAIKETAAETEQRQRACLFLDSESLAVGSSSVGELPFSLGLQDTTALYQDLFAARYYALVRELEAQNVAAKACVLDDSVFTTIPNLFDLFAKYPVQAVTVQFPAQTDGMEFEKEFENAFDRLGLWGGPYSSRQGIMSQWDFWRRQGPKGTAWLLNKVRHDNGNETVNAVSNVLANIGPAALPTILTYLQRNPSSDQARCLLDALSHLGPQETTDADQIARVIERFINSTDSDLRLSAIAATSVLPSLLAIQILTSAFTAETDSTVRGIIRDEIRERSGK